MDNGKENGTHYSIIGYILEVAMTIVGIVPRTYGEP